MTKILLVEDNQLNCEMFSRRLQRKGFDVVTAGDGQEAVNMAHSEMPDIILMDLSLPVMDGWTATQKVKASAQTRHMPVIALTAHAMVGDREKAISVGCDEHVTKPVDVPDLLKKIDRLLAEKGGGGSSSDAPRPSATGASRPSSVDQMRPSLQQPSRPPAMPAARPESSFDQSNHGGAMAGRILAVDDNPMNREMLLRRLQKEGYAVTLAENGSQALDLLGDHSYDLVLLDVMMPDISGMDVLSIIRTKHAQLELPVILVTAKDQTNDMVDAFQAGANDYVTKPYDFPVLLARLQSQLSLRRGQTSHSQTQHVAQQRQVAAAPQPVAVGSEATQELQFGSSDPRSEEGTRKVSSLSGSGSSAGYGSPSNSGSSYGSAYGESPSQSHTVADGDTTFNEELLSEYDLLHELGRGGMGVVYKARHRRMNRQVGLKIIGKDHLLRPSAIERFYREVQAAAQLSHRNIVMAFDARQAGDIHYLVMEYVEGVDLQQIINHRGALPWEDAREYMLQCARGLQHAHERGLVHRDIKPSNLLMTSDDPTITSREELLEKYRRGETPLKPTVKILDFGLALVYAPSENPNGAPALTLDGRVIGTADYMAPEQWMNAHKVDIRADLYSLGCTLYFLLTGRVPFPAEEPMEKMLKHHLEEPLPVQSIHPNVPDGMCKVLATLLAKKPEDRYQSPLEVIEALTSSSF